MEQSSPELRPPGIPYFMLFVALNADRFPHPPSVELDLGRYTPKSLAPSVFKGRMEAGFNFMVV
jgi:hypothetical protein